MSRGGKCIHFYKPTCVHTCMTINAIETKKVTQLCMTLCDPMNYTVHGILQATVLQWVAFPFSRGSLQTRNWTRVSCIAGGFFNSSATIRCIYKGWLKCLPAMRESRVQSLGQKDPLEKETATHSSILAWRIPWTEESSRLPVHGDAKESDTTEWLHFHFLFS